MINSCIIKEPKSKKDIDAYYFFRWKILRKPFGQLLGSEKDDYEKKSFHLMMVNKSNDILAIGRIHIVNNESNPLAAQIRYMAVKNKCERLGFGTMILKSLEKYAIDNNIKIIFLNSRESAIKFYKKNGYQIINKAHTLYGTIKHWSMQKKIKD